MNSYCWEYEMDPDFPISVIDYTTTTSEISIHWHHYLEIGLCLEGKGKFVFSEKEYSAQAGDVFLAGNFENHVAVAEDSGKSRYILILFLPELIAPFAGRKHEQEYLRVFNYNPDSFAHKIAAGTAAARELGSDIRKLKHIWDTKPADYKNIIDVLLRKILLALMEHYGANAEGTREAELLQHRIRKSLTYIRSNFRKPIKLYELAEMEHMSETNYRKVFKGAMHFGFKEYINFLRLTYAKQLLTQTELSVLKVGQESGYSNINQFYKVFHEYVGMSPAQFRRGEQSALNSKERSGTAQDDD